MDWRQRKQKPSWHLTIDLLRSWIVEALLVLCSWEHFSHAEFRHPPVSPEKTAVEEQTPEEDSLNDDLKQGFEDERVRLSLMKMHGYEEDARRVYSNAWQW